MLLLLLGLSQGHSQCGWRGPCPSFPRRFLPLSYSFTAKFTKGKSINSVGSLSVLFVLKHQWPEQSTWLGLARPGLWSSDTDTLYSLSCCFGAGIAVFLDLPDIAKTSSTWRCRTGLLACVAEASCLKLRQHMLGALVSCRGWWRG